MHPVLLLLLAILTPILLTLALLTPLYVSLVGGCYLVYALSHTGAAQGLIARMGDPFFFVEVYRNLLERWFVDPLHAPFFTYSLPMLIPVVGLVASFWCASKLARGLKNLFQSGTLV